MHQVGEMRDRENNFPVAYFVYSYDGKPPPPQKTLRVLRGAPRVCRLHLPLDQVWDVGDDEGCGDGGRHPHVRRRLVHGLAHLAVKVRLVSQAVSVQDVLRKE